ncbi:MAG: type I restriction enzyme endonuclease domain-containing protein [Cyclobacteriaceae bacterium]
MIEQYNTGHQDITDLYNMLTQLGEDLTVEQQRAHQEGLTEEQLLFFDLLRADGLSKEEKKKVKETAKALIEALPTVTILNWRLDLQSQLQVKEAVRSVLDKTLPAKYDQPLFKEKVNAVYEYLESRAKG